MTPTERAKKITVHFENNYPVGPKNWYSECEPYIAAQIEEAEREAVAERGRLFQESVAKFPQELKEAYAEGFRVAREEAKEIAEKLPTTELGRDAAKQIAQRIVEMEP